MNMYDVRKCWVDELRGVDAMLEGCNPRRKKGAARLLQRGSKRRCKRKKKGKKLFDNRL